MGFPPVLFRQILYETLQIFTHLFNLLVLYLPPDYTPASLASLITFWKHPDRASLVAHVVKNLPAVQDTCILPWSGRSLGEGNGWLPTPVFLPGEFHRHLHFSSRKSFPFLNLGDTNWCSLTQGEVFIFSWRIKDSMKRLLGRMAGSQDTGVAAAAAAHS